jgi:hypothetical protein
LEETALPEDTTEPQTMLLRGRKERREDDVDGNLAG